MMCQWNSLVPLNFGDVPRFVLSYGSGVQVSRVYSLKLPTCQKNSLIPDGSFHNSTSQTDENQLYPALAIRLGAGKLAPFNRAVRELHAQAKTIQCFWQTINHSSDSRKSPH